jgi:hypothetical protein
VRSGKSGEVDRSLDAWHLRLDHDLLLIKTTKFLVSTLECTQVEIYFSGDGIA